MNIRINFPISIKESAENLLKISLNLYVDLKNIDVLIILPYSS